MIRSPPASLSFKGQATRHTTVNWSVINVFLGGGVQIIVTVSLSLGIAKFREITNQT